MVGGYLISLKKIDVFEQRRITLSVFCVNHCPKSFPKWYFGQATPNMVN